jgi:hypothetical protein
VSATLLQGAAITGRNGFVRCWKCCDENPVRNAPLWGVCWLCKTATGAEGRRYELEAVRYPSGEHAGWVAREVVDAVAEPPSREETE